MTTGYTSFIESGEITNGKEFLKLCTRAMDVAACVRDKPLTEPTPHSFKPDTYYKEKYIEELRRLSEAVNMSFEDAKAQMIAQHEDIISTYKRIIDESLENNDRYLKVKTDVQAWTPPSEQHKGLKKFALEQINMCIEDEEYIDMYKAKINEQFDTSDEAVEEYISDNVARCFNNVNRAFDAWQAELDRTKKRNDWMSQFLKSIGE